MMTWSTNNPDTEHRKDIYVTCFVTLLSEAVGVYFGTYEMNYSNAKLNAQEKPICGYSYI